MNSTMKLTTLLVLSFFLVTEGLSRRRGRRQLFSFIIISNESVPCEELMQQEHNADSSKPLALSDDEKNALFKQSGGYLGSNIMATSKEEADKSFRSRLPITPKVKKLMAEYSRPTSKGSSLNKDQEMTNVDIMNFLKQHNRHKSSDNTVNKTHTQPRRDAQDRQTHHEETQQAEQLPVIEKWPLALASDLGIPAVQKTARGNMNIQFCLERGGVVGGTIPTHLRMCSVCSAVLDMGLTVWPQYLNEAICNPNDAKCLIVDGIPNGKCIENRMAIHFLQRQEGQCVLVLKDGQRVVAESWAMEERGIGVGCECAIDERSWLSEFV